VHDGNSVLVEALLANAGPAGSTTVSANTTVTRIEALHGRGFYVHSTTTDGAGQRRQAKELVDQVIIAAPLERSGITITGLPSARILDRGFTDWFVTVVAAPSLNLAQFGGAPSSLNAEDCTVLTSANGSTALVPYVCVQPLGKHGSGDAAGVFMVYSDK
jgi:hypothetical protein